MKCKGDKYCIREAKYKITIKEEHGRLIEYKERFLCGVCLISQCIQSDGLKEEIEGVTRL